MHKITFGRIRMRILQVLWRKNRANALEITNSINELEHVAHSTVQSHLRALEKQGAVAHDIEDRTFVFYPLIDEEKVMKSKMKDFIGLFFSGSAESLVLYLINNKYISKNEMKKVVG